ncbi:MAG: FimV/HubP family polar landmark protein [Gammaproteobacteria bacterium]
MRNLGPIITFCLAGIALPLNGFALGLGEIEVDSFLNQPLKAEIVVISTRAGEIDDLLVSLASREAFTRAGLSRPSHLSELRFSVKKNEEGDEAVILINTRSAIKEPFLNFLVEADWSKGRLIKEFTVLLDPPFYADSAPPAEPSPPVQAEPVVEAPIARETSDSSSMIGDQQTATEPIATAAPIATVEPIATTEPIATSEPIATVDPLTISDTDQLDEASAQPSEGEYIAENSGITFDGEVQIIKGDTLWSLAARYKDSEHSMGQVMLALLRSNPAAFGDNNINYLKIGEVLRAPDADELDLLSKQEAYAQVLEQYGLWDDYVARVTGTTSAAMADDGGITATTDSSTEDKGDLSLLAPGDGDSDAAGLLSDGEDANELTRQLAFAEEELEASRIENLELESKIADLEARLNKFEELQKMIEIEDDSLAQLQASQVEEQTVIEEIEAQDADFADEDLLEDLLADEAAAEAEISDVVAETDLVEEVVEEESTESPPAPAIVTEPVQKTGTILDDILPPDILNMIPAGLLEILPTIGMVMRDPIILGALVGIVVMLLVLVLYRRRKRSFDDDDEDEEGITGSVPEEDEFGDELTPVGLVGEAGGEEETNIKIPSEEDLIKPAEEDEEEQDDFMATSVIAKADIGEVQAEDTAAPEQDDVLDEVDVYLAYGLYENAEELLNQNIASNPDRADYRSKLLDTYYATRNVGEFVKQAETLKSMGSVADRYWDRVQVMGYELAPDNSLFSGGKDSTLTPADLGVTKPQAADFDIGVEDDETNFSVTDFNLGEDADDISETQAIADPQAGSDLAATARVDDTKVREEAVSSDMDDLDFVFGGGDDDSAAEAADAEGMDFELPDEIDLGKGDAPGEVDEPLEATAVVDLPDDLSDDFTDLGDLGDLDADDVASAAGTASGEAEKTESTAVLGTIDFPDEAPDELELVELEDETNIEATAMVDTVDFPATADDIDLGLDVTSEQPHIGSADDKLEMDLGDDDFEDSVVMDIDMDIDMDMDNEETKTKTFAPGDFDDPEELSADETEIEGVDIDDISGLMLPDDVDEVSTKLDLARAFIDMGDAEGARSSLNEVMAEGDDEQKAEAQTLLGQI